MKLTGYIKGVMLNIPTKFEGIQKKLNFCEILGILKKFDLSTVVLPFMVLKCMKFTRKTSLVHNENGLAMVEIYSTYFSLSLVIVQDSHIT